MSAMNQPHAMTDNPELAPQAAAPEDDEISVLDLLHTVVDNLRLLVLTPVAAGLLALGYSYTIPPNFTASTQFLPPQQQQSAAASMLQSLGSSGGLAGAASGIKNPNEQFVTFLKSRRIQDALIEQLNLKAHYGGNQLTGVRSALAASTAIAIGRDGLITIAVTDKNPEFAARLANAHVEQLGNLLHNLALTEAQQRRAFFERQLANTKDNLAIAESALKASGISSDTLKKDPQTALTGLAQLEASIAVQEVKLASMRGYLTTSAPEFKQAQTELAALRSQVEKSERQLPKAAGSEADYTTKFRDFKYQETMFELFAKQYEIAKVDESRESAVIQVLDTATPPEVKSGPKKAQIAVLTTLATGFALLLFVFVRQALRNAGEDAESAAKLAQLRHAWRKALGRG